MASSPPPGGTGTTTSMGRSLPPYSPDLNPIEQVFAKLKALLRGEAARTVEALWAAVGRLIARFSPGECIRYLAHCGYGRSG